MSLVAVAVTVTLAAVAMGASAILDAGCDDLHGLCRQRLLSDRNR